MKKWMLFLCGVVTGACLFFVGNYVYHYIGHRDVYIGHSGLSFMPVPADSKLPDVTKENFQELMKNSSYETIRTSISSKEVEASLSNMDKINATFRAVPNFSGGKPFGFKILSAAPNSIFTKVGFRRGDVLFFLEVGGLGYFVDSTYVAGPIAEAFSTGPRESVFWVQRRGKLVRIAVTCK